MRIKFHPNESFSINRANAHCKSSKHAANQLTNTHTPESSSYSPDILQIFSRLRSEIAKQLFLTLRYEIYIIIYISLYGSTVFCKLIKVGNSNQKMCNRVYNHFRVASEQSCVVSCGNFGFN